jgi:hypothetical protein
MALLARTIKPRHLCGSSVKSIPSINVSLGLLESKEKQNLFLVGQEVTPPLTWQSDRK